MRTTVEIDHTQLYWIRHAPDHFASLLIKATRDEEGAAEDLRRYFGVTIKHQTTEATDES